MPETPEAPPTTGPIAGKYELVRLIGRGGMGTVWEGRHSSLGTRVAIKFIDAEYADSQEARARFDNEARAAATIQSKHAIQIYDHGCTDDGKPYIVMELLLGEPLDARIDRLKQLPLAETTRILRQVARALARAHERGIVHRDLKPENVFLVRTPDEDEEIAKVLDFGIAKFKKVDGQTSSGEVSSSTKTGAVLGTPFYMSPEQARGLREIDHRSDLWSMGVIAFKCVCGVLPFEGVSVGDLLVKVCTTPAPVPSRLVPSLPASFDAWFARSLEKEPARRFQSAAELADALADAAGVGGRRAGSMSPTSDPIAVPAASFAPPRSIDGPTNQTSAPFTSPARTGASSRSVYVAAIAATALGVALGVVAVVRRGQPPRAAQGTVVNASPAHDMPSALATTVQTMPDAGPATPLVVVTDLPHEKGAPKHGNHPGAPKTTGAAALSALPPAIPPAQAAVAPSPPASEPRPAPKATANVMDPGY